MKKLWLIPLVILLLVLVVAPFAIRWLYFYEGRFPPRTIARPDLTGVGVAAPPRADYADAAEAAPPGTILVDLSHDNDFGSTDLSVLQARLAARGQTVEMVNAAEDLPAQLRYAKGLIIISPLTDWSALEVEAVGALVARGGRLLLIADATHYLAEYDDWGFLISLDHDAPHLNGLAAQFGLQFQPDYLYNTSENANNFRNIKLSDLTANPLTEGVEELVFFATRSIASEAPGLVLAGGETRSNADDRVEKPVAVALAADGLVLALGDSTFLSEPYNGIADNDRFTSNIADFLSGAERLYALDDFPYFFRDEADLVYTSDPLLDSDLLSGAGDLQTLFSEAGKMLSVEDAEVEVRDTLFLGLYEEAEEAEDYLADAQVTLILPPEEELNIEAGLDFTTTLEATEEYTSRVEIESVGSMVIDGTALIVLVTQGDRRVLVVLSDTVTGLQATIDRLIDGDLGSCMLHETGDAGTPSLALCSTGELEAGEGTGGWPEPEDEESEEEEWP
jgi:hypothetical protein